MAAFLGARRPKFDLNRLSQDNFNDYQAKSPRFYLY